MTRKTQLTSLLALGGALLVSGIAQAQEVPAGAPGATGAPSELGTVSNQTTTTTTTVSDPSIITEDTTVAAMPETLPETGGEPWMLALGGSLLAGTALVMRRKVGQN